ncbi:MAG: phage late control D family protein [Nitrosospira sp.]
MPGLGLRLQLLIGPTVPLPAPYALVDALLDVEVNNRDQDFDGFKITFSLGKDSLLDYGLLMSGLLDPPSRVVISVFIGVLPEVLIDGIITNHQVMPSNKPGESNLHVFGKDISLKLDLEERDKSYPNQPDSLIVAQLIASYATLGLVPQITPTTDVPIQTDRIPSQQGTDLDYIKQLARRNGFVFYIEPTSVPGANTAYWGVDNRLGVPQSALTMNMGADTNVDNPITFDFDALGPAEPQVSIVEPLTRVTIPIPLPASLRPPLVRKPAIPLRKTLPRNTANLNPVQAALRGLSSTSESADAVTGSGEMDAVRYGRALRSRRLVGVRGVGESYDGNYYVKEVTHRIKRGEYKQSFTLSREGHGALLPMVVP